MSGGAAWLLISLSCFRCSVFLRGWLSFRLLCAGSSARVGLRVCTLRGRFARFVVILLQGCAAFRLVHRCAFVGQVVQVGVVVVLVLRSEVVRNNVWPYGSLRAAVQFGDLVPVAPGWDASVQEKLVEVQLMF